MSIGTVVGGSTRTPHLIVVVGLHAGRTLLGWIRTPAILASAVGMPVVMLVIMLVMFGKSIEAATGASLLDGLVPLMICTGPMFAGVSSAAALVTERASGLLTRFRTLPGRRAAPMIGRIVAEVVRGVVGGVLVLATGFALGYRVSTGIVGVLGMLGFAALVSLAFGALMTWVGSIARTPESTVAAGPLLMIVMFFNNGFMPAAGFPVYLRPIVEVSPLSAVITGMNAVATGEGSVLPGIAWLTGITLVAVTLLATALRRRQ